MCSAVVVHRAPWLLPVTRQPIFDGGIAVRGGRIVEIGGFNRVVRSYSGAKVVDHPDVVLMPGLINVHTHLELSHLAYLSRKPAPPSFTGWIQHMLAERAKVDADNEILHEAARIVLADQERQGVVAVADISNTGLIRELIPEFPGHLLCFKEYMSLRAADVDPLRRAIQVEAEHLCTAHAPYSTHIDLLRALKEKAVSGNGIFPIHAAESSAEHVMISQGNGEMREFLEQRGFWDGTFRPTGTENEGSVSYLYRHGILDKRTLCVHAVHVTGQEMDRLLETGATVCLCPGSNRYLGVGTAPAGQYLKKGILPALGTDSLTSNPELSLWREMRLLTERHPGIDPANILRMATLGGARALGLDRELGVLEPGKEAVILAVELPWLMKHAGAVQEYLACGDGHFLARI